MSMAPMFTRTRPNTVSHGAVLDFETLYPDGDLAPVRIRPGEDTLLRVIAGVVRLTVDGAERLLDEETREFQNGLIAGPPPLGPGAPATERLHAFGTGYLELLERHADLLVAAGASEFDGRGPYQLYATHVAILLREAAPQLDPETAARSLMATLAPGEFLFVRLRLGWTLERVVDSWCEFVSALTGRGSR